MAIYTQAQRNRYATVKSGGQEKFPISDRAHALAALARLNQAKPPLTPAQKAKVRAKAYRTLGKKRPKKMDQREPGS